MKNGKPPPCIPVHISRLKKVPPLTSLKPRLSRYQLKIALTYMVIFGLTLLLLNTYPVRILRDFVMTQKRSSMRAQAEIMTRALSGFDGLNQENAARVLSLLDDESYRVLVCDPDGLLIYDNASAGNAKGRRALVSELRHALQGYDVFRSAYEARTFDSSFAMPILSRGAVLGALYLGEYDSSQAAMLGSLRGILLTASLVVFGVVLVFSLFISAAMTRRLTGILRAIRSVRDGRYDYKIRDRGKDELGELATYMNELTAILEKTESLRQQFVSNASHELKTPLASMRLLTDSILSTEDMPKDILREFVADIGEETDRLGRMTERLMALSRLDSLVTVRDELNPAAVIHRAARMLAPVAKQAGVTLRCELSDDARVLGSEDELYQIVFNLMDNAIKYNRYGGTVQVYLYAPAHEVRIVVADSGVGIPEADLPFIFDRFYRVDKARSREAGGTGLGLSIVSQAAARMGARIHAESTLGEGSRFTLSFYD